LKLEFRLLGSFFGKPKSSLTPSFVVIGQAECLSASSVIRAIISELAEGLEMSDFDKMSVQLSIRSVNALVARIITLKYPW
jgi:hypothetical protein